MAKLTLVRTIPRPQPWNPATATEEIRKIATSVDLKLTYRDHLIEQLLDRGLIIGDVRHALKHGFVYAAAQTTTRDEYYKYLVENKTPNSGSRAIRVIVIPDPARCWLKVLEVMWIDERLYMGR
jgi:hypothetical protein